MSDKMLMEGLLWDTKVMADLCLHGSIESATDEVHKTFLIGLKEVMTMQNDIYTTMSDQGWYKTDQVLESKLTQAKEKFSTALEEE